MQAVRRFLTFGDLIGIPVNLLDKLGVIEGYTTNGGLLTGIIVQEVPELDPIQSEQCPHCKAIESIEKKYYGPDAKKGFQDFGGGI